MCSVVLVKSGQACSLETVLGLCRGGVAGCALVGALWEAASDLLYCPVAGGSLLKSSVWPAAGKQPFSESPGISGRFPGNNLSPVLLSQLPDQAAPLLPVFSGSTHFP